MKRLSRADILEKLRATIARGEPIVGGGAGTGLSAKCEEAGGIDLIVIYNSGRYRMAGRGSLAGCSRTATRTRSSSTWRARCCPSSSRRPCSPA
nr:phosphoenolpyruvate hydrolase family protein [Burkholderia humptydooensis]